MARAATTLSGPNARAAILRNPLGATYHSSLPTGLAAEMPRDVPLQFAGASQAGVDSESPSSGEVPNSIVVRRAGRKRLADTAAEKRIAQVAKIDGRLGSVGGASASIRECVLLQFLLSDCFVPRRPVLSSGVCPRLLVF